MNERSACMGCGACVDMCPTHCIELKSNKMGFEERIVNQEKCIGCKKCEKVCQVIHPLNLNRITKLYAASTVNKTANSASTSAGIATVLAKTFIENGGMVAGVRWTQESGAEYCITDNISDIEQFRGSKYVYPNISGLYSAIMHAREENRKILFIGLPCIVAGIKCTVGESDSIYYVDLICHGAPQASFLQQHLAAKGFKSYPAYISFRDKNEYILRANDDTGAYTAEHYKDNYLYGFLNGLIQKEYCFECPYSYENRVGDITLGDAWNQTVLREEKTSLIAINSSKGETLLKSVVESIIMAPYDLNLFRKEGHQLKGPTKRHLKRQLFQSRLIIDGFEKAADKALGSEMKILQMRKLASRFKQAVRGRNK